MRFPIAAAILFALTVGASAQFPMGPGMPVPGAPQPQQQQPPCVAEFTPLRNEAQKRGTALSEAVKRKVPREQVCSLIKSFSVSEAKVVAYVTKNQQTCGVPADAVAQMTANHKRTMMSEKQVCADGPAGRPTGPSLSEALGVARAPTTTDATAPRSGTMDTLTGNALQR